MPTSFSLPRDGELPSCRGLQPTEYILRRGLTLSVLLAAAALTGVAGQEIGGSGTATPTGAASARIGSPTTAASQLSVGASTSTSSSAGGSMPAPTVTPSMPATTTTSGRRSTPPPNAAPSTAPSTAAPSSAPTSSTPTNHPTAAPSHGTYAVPRSIDQTGNSDVTAALQAFLDRVPDGSTISFPHNARYRVEGTLTLTARRNLTIQGNGATVFATTRGSRNRSQWDFVRDQGLTVHDMVVRGANPNAGVGVDAYQAALEAQHGFEVLGSRDVGLNEVTVTDTYGDFVYVGSSHGPSVDVRVEHSSFARSGRQGLSAVDAQDVRFDHNVITDTRRATFDLEPDSPEWQVQSIMIDHNQVGPGRLLFVAAAGRGPVNGVSIVDNTLTGRNLNISVVTPTGKRRYNWLITGNTSNGVYGSPSGGAINLTRVSGITVTGNTQTLQKGRNMAGVQAKQSCDVTVSNNHFANARPEPAIAYQACPASEAPPA